MTGRADEHSISAVYTHFVLVHSPHHCDHIMDDRTSIWMVGAKQAITLGQEEELNDHIDMDKMLESHRGHYGRPWRLDLGLNQTNQPQQTSSKQPKTIELAVKGDCTCNAGKCYDRDRKDNPIRYGFRDTWDRQPMLGVYFTHQRRLCGTAAAIRQSCEGIRWDENDERANRHATLELEQ